MRAWRCKACAHYNKHSMNIKSRRRIIFLLLGAMFGVHAIAQPYPTKPIRLLTAEVGGGSDFAARLISQRLSENLRQQIVVDNRTGGVIIGDIASKAQPDGYTLMLYS